MIVLEIWHSGTFIERDIDTDLIFGIWYDANLNLSFLYRQMRE